MHQRIALFAISIALVGCASFAFAQNPPAAPPKPGPEVKKLAAFVGKWSETGNMKPGPMGPGGKYTGTEDCQWTSGGFALLCRETSDMGAMGKSTGTAMIGYDADKKEYVYCEVDSMGELEISRGHISGDAWTFEDDSTMNGQPYHGRFTMTFPSKDTLSMKFEMGPNAGSMQLAMEGTGKKALAAPAK